MKKKVNLNLLKYIKIYKYIDIKYNNILLKIKAF